MAYKENIGENGRLSDAVLKPIDTGQKLYIPASISYMRMKNDALKDGVNIQLVGQYSGYRPCGMKGDYTQRRCNTGFTQWCAYEQYRAGVGNLAATPSSDGSCNSNHGFGIAIDVKNNDGKAWIRKNGIKYGWWWGEAPTENWHFTYDIDRDTYLDKSKLKQLLEDSGEVVESVVEDGGSFVQKNWIPIALILAGIGGITFFLIKTKRLKFG